MKHLSHIAFFIAFSTAGTASAVPFALSPDGNAVVRITPQTSAPALDTSLVTTAYPGWTVTNGAADGGSFTTSTYTAGWSGGGGGAQFAGSYSQTKSVGAGAQLNYIQIVDSNVSIARETYPLIDPIPNDDTLPFYFTNSEVASRSTTKSASFSDFSRRDAASLSSTNPITWSANLYPVVYDRATTVVVGNGVQWGWTMKPATVGSAAATFNSPSPTCPPATCSGIGTSSIAWGTGSPGGMSFSGDSFAPKVGDPFKLGTLRYTNGATFVGSALDGISLDIALGFDNVPERNFIYHAGLTITNTPNTDDPIASADFVTFATGGFSDSFHVLEGASATADLMAKLTPMFSITPSSIVDKDPFTNPGALAFLGYDLQLVAFANPSGGGFVTGVPSPGTFALFLIGLVALQMATWNSTRRRDV